MSAVAWIDAAAQLPDDDTLVLIALNEDGDVWIGFRNAGEWMYPDAMPITRERVTHWTHLPAGPVAAGAAA